VSARWNRITCSGQDPYKRRIESPHREGDVSEGAGNGLREAGHYESKSANHAGSSHRWAGIALGSLLAALVAALVAFGLRTPADANSFGYPGNYAANNGNHEIYFSIYLDSDLASDTQLSMTYALNPHPDIYSYLNRTYRSYNDVRVYDGTYGTGWYAASGPCVGSEGGSGQGTYCKPRQVRYNRGTYPSAFNTQAERRHFSCHELGHTFGLFHDSGGCLSTSGVSYYFGSHNYDHLHFYD